MKVESMESTPISTAGSSGEQNSTRGAAERDKMKLVVCSRAVFPNCKGKQGRHVEMTVKNLTNGQQGMAL